MTTKVEPSGVLNAHEVYTIRQFKARLCISEKAFRTLRLAGLPVIRIGNRGYLSGRQVIEFLEGLLTDGRSDSSEGN